MVVVSALGGPPLLTDSDVDAIACRFVRSPYADNTMYREWPLDRRIEGFLRREGLVRLAEDGDACDLILGRVMAYISAVPHPAVELRTSER